MKHQLPLLLLLCICLTSAANIEQTCHGDNCVQITQNTGIIQIEGRVVTADVKPQAIAA